MTLSLNTVRNYYNHEEKIRLEKLGFQFSRLENIPDWIDDDSHWQKDTENLPEIQLDTLEDLCNIMGNYGEVIISLSEMTIYDGCAE